MDASSSAVLPMVKVPRREVIFFSLGLSPNLQAIGAKPH